MVGKWFVHCYIPVSNKMHRSLLSVKDADKQQMRYENGGHAAELSPNVGWDQESRPHLNKALNWRRNPEHNKDRAEAEQTSQSQDNMVIKDIARWTQKPKALPENQERSGTQKGEGQDYLITTRSKRTESKRPHVFPFISHPSPGPQVLLLPTLYRRGNKNMEN